MGLDISGDGRHLYVADWYGARLLVFDARGSGAAPPLASIPVGRAPAGVAAHTDSATVFVAERDDDSVAVIDTAKRRVLARVRVGSHPFALLYDAPRARLYALNVQSDDISVIDMRDTRRPAVIATVKVGKSPYGAALAQGGALLFVTNQRDDTVSVVDADSLRVRRTSPASPIPRASPRTRTASMS